MTDETPEQNTDAEEDDATRKQFREALARKKGNKQSHGAGPHAGSKVHDTGARAAKRMFRRKSG